MKRFAGFAPDGLRHLLLLLRAFPKKQFQCTIRRRILKAFEKDFICQKGIIKEVKFKLLLLLRLNKEIATTLL